MKVQATVVGFLICAATTFVEAGPVPSSTDAATSGSVAAQTSVVQEPSATSVSAAPAQQRNPGARAGDTSDNDNTSRLVLLALVVMGSIALRRGRSA